MWYVYTSIGKGYHLTHASARGGIEGQGMDFNEAYDKGMLEARTVDVKLQERALIHPEGKATTVLREVFIPQADRDLRVGRS